MEANKMKKQKTRKGKFGILLVLLLIAAAVGVFFFSKHSPAMLQEAEGVAPSNVNQKGYDVVYVIDNSGSVWHQQKQRNQAMKNITNLAVGSDIRVGVVYFADREYKKIGLTALDTEKNSKKVLDFLEMEEQDESNRDTNIGNALESAIGLFDDQDMSRKRIVVLFSDGINQNRAKDRAYAKKANKKTREQVKILRKMDIPIYCVYLQKKNNDEAYLRKVVRYFSEDNDYDVSRFSKVKAKNISQLSKTFSKVFFAMQNDMKHRQIELDDSGTVNFYVPSLGITDLSIYLDGELGSGGQVTSPDGSEAGEHWTDGSAEFFIYRKPKSGSWSLEVPTKNPDKVHGTIAYYTDLNARMDLAECAEEQGKKQLEVHFNKSDGSSIDIDEMAKVSSVLHFVGTDGTEKTDELKMKITDGYAISEPLSVDAYGEYTFHTGLEYEDFVDLQYEFEPVSAEKAAPVVTDLSGEKFKADRTERGLTFVVPESSLWTDTDAVTAEVDKIKQQNSENPVSVVQKDGNLIVTAKSDGKVSFVLPLRDESGMTASVSVAGKVKDVAKIHKRRMIMVVIVSVAAIIGALIGIYAVLRKIKEGKRNEALIAQYAKNYQQTQGSLAELLRMLKECKADIGEIQKDINDVDAEMDQYDQLTADLPLAVKEYFSIEKPEMATIENERRAVDNIANETRTYQQQINNLPNTADQTNVSSAAGALGTCTKDIGNCLQEVKKQAETIKRKSNSMRKSAKSLKDTNAKIQALAKTPVGCRLGVTISVNGTEMAGQMAPDDYGVPRTGTYQLEDVRILGYELPRTDISVFGYTNSDNEEKGLVFVSPTAKPFKVNGETAHKKQLPIGSYDLEVLGIRMRIQII